MAALARGQGASPGQARGPLATSAEAAVRFAQKGTPAILVRIEASVEDMDGIRACAGLVTTRGGITGDGAIAARALGKPCVAAVASVRVLYTERRVTFVTDDGEVPVGEGDLIAVDAGRGVVTTE